MESTKSSEDDWEILLPQGLFHFQPSSAGDELVFIGYPFRIERDQVIFLENNLIFDTFIIFWRITFLKENYKWNGHLKVKVSIHTFG